MTLEELIGHDYHIDELYSLGPKHDNKGWAVILEHIEAPDDEWQYATGPDIFTAVQNAIEKAQQAARNRAEQSEV